MKRHQTKAAMILRGMGLLLGAAATAGFARILQPEKFGEFSFVLAVIAILSIPQTVGLRQTLVRELAYARARAAPQRALDIWRWSLISAFGMTVVIVLLAAAWVYWGVRDLDLKWQLALGLGIYILMPAPQLLSGALQGMGRALHSQLPEFMIKPVLTMSLIGLAWATLPDGSIGVTEALGIVALAVIADGLLGFALLRRQPDFQLWPNSSTDLRPEHRSLNMAALSFGAIASVHLINGNLDIFMLGLLRSAAEVGIYRAAAVLSLLAVFGLGVVNAIILPRIANLHAAGDKDALQRVVTRATRVSSAFALGGVLVIGLMGGLLLTVIFDNGYGGGHTALLILTAGQFVNACFGPVAIILNMTGHQRITLIGMSASVVVNAALNLALVPRFGIEGAAVATMASLIVWNVVLAQSLKARTGYSTWIYSK